MKFSTLSLLSLSAFHLPIFTAANGLSDGPLTQPVVLSSVTPDLEIDLSLAEGQHTTVAATTFNTRLLGGSLPGPTLRVRRGEWLYVNFENDLVEQPGTNTVQGEFAWPDSTNLHFHGPHISGERPGDDTTLIIDPGESFRYEVFIPEDHIGGIHWVHPHRHGSGTLQIGGGAALALVIEDEEGELPVEVENAEEIILMVQLFDNDTFENKIVPQSGDGLFNLVTADNVGDEFRLVNGQYKPTLDIIAGDWQRWRVIFGSWDKNPLDLEMETDGVCEMVLLAKDGIYISDYPRPLDKYPISTGGRTDIMVRCSATGEFTVTDYGGDLFTLNVVEPPNGAEIDVSTPATEGFVFERPSYLTDLQSSTPTPGCSCDTYMNSNQMNGLSYNPELFLHTVALGSIVERTISGVESHPYHQHVYPFQLQQFFGINGEDNDYFKLGDYHDSLMVRSSDTVKVRYLPNNFHGRMTVHCHRVDHSDKGMLSAEDIVDGGVCSCSPKFNAVGFTRAPTSEPTSAPTKAPVDYCENCKAIWLKTAKIKDVANCARKCVRKQRSFKLKPKCNKKCCKVLCRNNNSALEACTEKGYCTGTDSPTA